MNIGIIGAGGVGGTLGKLWSRAGHTILFSSRHPEQLKPLADEAGNVARTGTVAEAAEFSDVVLLAVNYWTLDEALREIQDKLQYFSVNYKLKVMKVLFS